MRRARTPGLAFFHYPRVGTAKTNREFNLLAISNVPALHAYKVNFSVTRVESSMLRIIGQSVQELRPNEQLQQV